MVGTYLNLFILLFHAPARAILRPESRLHPPKFSVPGTRWGSNFLPRYRPISATEKRLLNSPTTRCAQHEWDEEEAEEEEEARVEEEEVEEEEAVTYGRDGRGRGGEGARGVGGGRAPRESVMVLAVRVAMPVVPWRVAVQAHLGTPGRRVRTEGGAARSSSRRGLVASGGTAMVWAACEWLGGGAASVAVAMAEEDVSGVGRMSVGDLALMAGEAFESRDYAAAERAFDELVRREPEAGVWRDGRAQVRIDAKKFRGALEDADVYVRVAPTEPRAYSTRGLAQEGLSNWEAAVQDYTTALEYGARLEGGGRDPYVLNSRGNAYNSMGEFQLALEDYTDAFLQFQRYKRLSPAVYAQSNAALMRVQLNPDNVDENVKLLRDVARRGPGSIDVRAALAALLYAAGRVDEAEEEWEFACRSINSGSMQSMEYGVQVTVDGCRQYKDFDWLRRIRRWPPVLVDRMEAFLRLR